MVRSNFEDCPVSHGQDLRLQGLDTPYRDAGHRYALLHLLFQLSQVIALHMIPRSPYCRQKKEREEVSQLKLPSGGYRAIGV